MPASAIVTLKIQVTLNQGWGDECTVEQVKKQARDSALRKVGQWIEKREDIKLISEPEVAAIYEGGM
jgi:hypothetical protein